MKLATRQDIEAPMEFVFQSLMDFESWERSAMRRGADVSRTDEMRETGPGMGWLVRFTYRGKERKVTIKLTAIEAPGHLAFAGGSPNADGTLTLHLFDMAARRTRIQVGMEVTARSLVARLFLQSLRFARAKVDRRFSQRVNTMAEVIEERYRRTQSPPRR